MSIRKLPRAWFSSKLPPGRKGRKELAGRLEKHLANCFGPVKVVQPLFLPWSILRFSVSGGHFQITMGPARRPGPVKSAWYVLIDPAARWPPKLSNEELKNCAPGLMLISNEIHSLLAGISEITRLRWGFEAGWTKVQTVRSPAALPWDVDLPDVARR